MLGSLMLRNPCYVYFNKKKKKGKKILFGQDGEPLVSFFFVLGP